MYKPLTIVSIILLFIFATMGSSCKKVRENNLIAGLWKLDDIYIDTLSQNQLENLPHYTDGNNCCNYRLDFQDGTVVFGYYLTYDTINLVRYGTWQLNDYTHLQINLGDYLDGNFTISKTSPTKFKMTCTNNHIRAYDNGVNPALDTARTVFDMEKL